MIAQKKFWILSIIVAISGLSQGLLLPLIAIIFERNDISSGINGLHASGIYLGILFISPFIEAPLHKFGYKPIILIGGLIVGLGLFAFSLWFNLYFWFLLRLLIGVGDHMLHFSSQTWVGALTEPSKRGRNMAIYGLFFSLGFAVGPQIVNFIHINPNFPFYFSGGLVILAWGLVWLIKNDFVMSDEKTPKIYFSESLKRFSIVGKIAWVAMIPPFLYGVLETGLNATFPIVGMREGLETFKITIIISSFSVGTILFQVPVGIISDRIGRQHVLPVLMILGGCIFLTAALIHNFWLFVIIFFILGILIGSLYSLGLSYMTDLTPISLLPAGNILVGMCFSIGSIFGPSLTGSLISLFGTKIFYFIVAFLLVVGGICLIKNKKVGRTEL